MSFKTSLKEYLRRLETFNDSLQNNFDLEAIRLESFKHCNTLSTHFSYIRLAADGFYFDKDFGRCVCFGCQINVSDGDFRQGKSVKDVHRSKSPSCRYISPTGRNTHTADLLDVEMPVHSTRQLSINEFGKNHRPKENTNERSAVELATSYNLFAGTQKPSHHTPIYPQFCQFEARRSTFMEWHKAQSPDDMAGAGFFYTGDNDCVKCFYCGLVLLQWEPEENPWVEHRKHYPECCFLKNNMPIRTPTQDYYELTGGAAATFETEQAYGGSTQMIVDESNYLDSPAARAVIELSTSPEKTKKHIEEALEILNRDRLRPTATEIAKLVYTLEERDNEIEKLAKQVEKYKLDQISERTCVICLHRERSRVFCPCGHVLCCVQCSDQLRQVVNPKCPTCRTIIDHCTRIYLC